MNRKVIRKAEGQMHQEKRGLFCREEEQIPRFLLKSKINEYMTPNQFIYKVVSLLLLNDNTFVYPLYDRKMLELMALYPLNTIIVEPSWKN